MRQARRLGLCVAAFAWTVSPGGAQVPGSAMGPPQDQRYAPGTSGPNIACRLFSVSCHTDRDAPPATASSPDGDTPVAKPARKTGR